MRRMISVSFVIATRLLAGCACDGAPPIAVVDAGVDAPEPVGDDAGTTSDAGVVPARCDEIAIAPWDLTTGVWSRVFAPSGLTLSGEGRAVVRAIDAQDGDVVVGGRFTHAGPTAIANVAAWTEDDGWRTLGGGLEGEVTALARDAEGAVLAARAIDELESEVLRLRAGAWESIGRANGEIRALAFDGDGALLVAGTFSQIDGVTALQLAHWDGGAWSGVAQVVSHVSSMLVDEHGLCIGGGLDTPPEVACLLAGATEWALLPFPTLGPGYHGRVDALARDASGALVAGGTIPLAAARPELIVRWDGTAWQPLGDSLEGQSVTSIATDAAGALWVAGDFHGVLAADAPRVSRVAMWDGTWHGVGGVWSVWTESGWPRGPHAIATDGADVYVGGNHDGAGETSWISALAIARHRGGTWSALRQPGADAHGIGPAQLVRSRGACGPIVIGSWVGGEEPGLGPIARMGDDDVLRPARTADFPYLAALRADVAIARDGTMWVGGWFFVPSSRDDLVVTDGDGWSSVLAPDGEPMRSVTALAIDPVDDTLYVGGDFGTTHLMARVGDRWTPVGDRDVGVVQALAVDEDRGLWVAAAIDATRARLSYWNGTTWRDTAAFEGVVSRMVIHRGVPVVTLAEPATDALVRELRGSVFVALERPAAMPTRVQDIAVHDGALLAVGTFEIEGVSHTGLARWQDEPFAEPTWRAIGAPLDGRPESLAITARGVLVAGSFEDAGGIPSWGIARFEPPR